MQKKTENGAYLNYFAIDETRSFAIKAVHKVQTIPVQLIQYGIDGLMEGIRIQKISGSHRPTHVTGL